ncbi:MAG: N-acetylglucosaminyl-diphospho-decaprenol L-rhamnosyltransferase [Desulforhopalus sp.]|jgi:N-acetylglucosaminyl-diphospho-decaprenol L-rhamnosyltransferase
MTNFSIAIVIVNFQTPWLIVDCLESLRHEQSELFTVVIVDNNSNDDSVPILSKEISKKGWETWVSLLPLPENGGFAYGNNAAITKLLNSDNPPDYFWLLNPDTIVHKGACIELVNFLKNHPHAAVAGSRLEDRDGTLQLSAFRNHSVISELLSGMRLGLLTKILSKWVVALAPISHAPFKTDWVSGASMMLRSDGINSIGLMDDGYFLYYEEVDYCIRLQKAGWECWYVPSSRVVHLIGASTGMTDYRKKASRRSTYWFESRRRFFLKNHGWITLFLADSLWILGYSLFMLRRQIQKKDTLDPPHFLRDFFINSIFCKGIRL